MCESVHKCVDQDLVGNDLVPPAEGEIGGDDCGPGFCSERQMVEEQFGTFLVAGDISELVADYKVVFLKAVLQPGHFVLASGFSDHGEQPRYGGEQHGVTPLARGDAQCGGQVCLSGARIAI